MPPAVRFGVNYTPSEGWVHHWLDFDLDSVRAFVAAYNFAKHLKALRWRTPF